MAVDLPELNSEEMRRVAQQIIVENGGERPEEITHRMAGRVIDRAGDPHPGLGGEEIISLYDRVEDRLAEMFEQS